MLPDRISNCYLPGSVDVLAASHVKCMYKVKLTEVGIKLLKLAYNFALCEGGDNH